MYFAQSPFFDPTSNNGIIINQAMYNPRMLPIVATRESFESHIKSIGGLEFVVAQEPAETAPGTGTGIWVIRKQRRQLKPLSQGGDEITILGTYFVVGENIYMAPAVGDVIGSRLVGAMHRFWLQQSTNSSQLSIFTSLNKFVSTASSLPNFSPALGHTYMPPASANRPKPDSQLGQLSQTSKENTPMPDSLPGSKKSSQQGAYSSTYISSRLLAESLEMSIRYGDEYMDENPITGHPGDFHLSTTGRKDKNKLAVPGGNKGTSSSQAKTSAPPTPEPKAGEVPPTRKGSKGDKSPRTPGMPKPKRRKSKAPLSAGGMTPISPT